MGKKRGRGGKTTLETVLCFYPKLKSGSTNSKIGSVNNSAYTTLNTMK